MNSSLAKKLDERFCWYKKLSDEAAWYSAFECLAEIFHCISKLPKDEQDAWTTRIQNEPLSDLALQEVKSGSRKDVQRIRRILSIGSRWNAEEILLIVQTRIELDLVFDFLNHLLSAESKVALDDIDEAIVALAKSKEHQRDLNGPLA
jgi:hypothetical protein